MVALLSAFLVCNSDQPSGYLEEQFCQYLEEETRWERLYENSRESVFKWPSSDIIILGYVNYCGLKSRRQYVHLVPLITWPNIISELFEKAWETREFMPCSISSHPPATEWGGEVFLRSKSTEHHRSQFTLAGLLILRRWRGCMTR